MFYSVRMTAKPVQLLSDLGWIPKITIQVNLKKKLNELKCCDNLLPSMIYCCARSRGLVHKYILLCVRQHIYVVVKRVEEETFKFIKVQVQYQFQLHCC